MEYNIDTLPKIETIQFQGERMIDLRFAPGDRSRLGALLTVTKGRLDEIAIIESGDILAAYPVEEGKSISVPYASADAVRCTSFEGAELTVMTSEIE